MTTYKPLRQDPVTQEYFYNGKWYDYYPFDKIKADEDESYEANNRKEKHTYDRFTPETGWQKITEWWEI